MLRKGKCSGDREGHKSSANRFPRESRGGFCNRPVGMASAPLMRAEKPLLQVSVLEKGAAPRTLAVELRGEWVCRGHCSFKRRRDSECLPDELCVVVGFAR